jgi:outer membrane protein assembly factor BamB
MRHTIILPLLWLAVGTVFAADRPMPGLGREALSIDNAALARAHLGTYWRLQLPLRPAEQVTMLSLIDEHLYAVTDRGELFAICAESGLMHWQRPIIGPGDVLFPLTHALVEGGGGPVVVTTPAWVALLDRETGRELPFADARSGQELPRFSLPVPPAASVVADAAHLYVAQVDDRFASYRRKDGFRQWVIGAKASGSTTPRLVSNRILFASDDGRLMMLSTERIDQGSLVWAEQMGTAPLEPFVGLTSKQRQRVWPREASTTPLEPIFLSEGDLFFTGSDQVVYSIDPKSGPVGGQCRWRRALSMRPEEGPTVVGDLMFQQDPGQGLLAIERHTGRLRWLLPRGKRLLARAAGMAYASSTDGHLLAADEITGNVRSRVPITGALFCPIDAIADAVFLAGRQGDIVCIRNPNAKSLRRSDFLPAPAPATRAATTTPAASNAPAPEAVPPATPPPPTAPLKAADGDVLRSSRP